MAGFREFATGEVLTSANVNDFLMKQSVMVFVDAAARTAALGAEVAEGMLTYNLDTDQLEVHDGSAFVSVASPPTTSASDLTSGTLALARFPATTLTLRDSVFRTDAFSASIASQARFSIPSMSVTLSATSATSKLIILGFAGSLDTDGSRTVGISVFNGTSELVVGNAGGAANYTTTSASNGQANYSFAIVHTPGSTASRTYTLRVTNGMRETRTVFFNRLSNDNPGSPFGAPRTSMGLIVMESK